ncbi:MAG: penicillin-binding protein activator [Alcanivoracaceae bacterium]|nr:penicillin-binding protein activator [Alcanivoracaceae bacterium]
MRLLLRGLLLAVFVWTAGCAQRPVDSTDVATAGVSRPAPTMSEDALRELAGLPASSADDTALAWAAEYLGLGKTEATAMLLNYLDGQVLNGPRQARRTLLRAQWHLVLQQPEQAEAALSDANLLAILPQLDNNLRSRIGLLRADALTLRGELVASLEQRVAVDHLLDSSSQEYNHSMIWTQLMLLPINELADAERRTDDATLSGWLELARLYRDPLSDIDGQLRNLNDWQQRRAHHPAASNMPDIIQALRKAVRERPQTVAVLLPQSGPLAAPAGAIRHGLLAAYYSALGQGHPVPAMHFLDSSQGDIVDLYNQALALGADLVIGPLDKEQAAALAAIADLPVTTLALNYIDGVAAANRLFQFGLAPEDEARQVAEQAIAEGMTLAAVLYPQDTSGWGLRVASAFSERFQELGGIISTQASYADNPTAITRSLLGIGQSEARARALRRYTGMQIEFEPRRRQDIDLVFLVANPMQARQMKPALNFHYASDLPVFATSHIYAGSPAPDRDTDLNGLRFVEMPWILDDGSALHQQSTKAWPDGHGRFEKLFAMGVDAYRLHARLMMLDSVPDSFLPGVTGQLSMNEQRVLVRRLNWAWFRKGRPQRMPVVAGSSTGDASHGRAANIVAPATR